MLSVRCEPTIPASERPQTKTLDRATTGIGKAVFVLQMCLVVRDYWYYVSVTLILWKRTYYWNTDFKFVSPNLSNITPKLLIVVMFVIIDEQTKFR